MALYLGSNQTGRGTDTRIRLGIRIPTAGAQPESASGHAGKPCAPPPPLELSTPRCAALGCPLLPRDVPCNLGSLRLRAAHSPPPDWSLQKCLGRQPSDTGLAAPESCSSAHFPGSFDHAPTGSSGALEQTEGVPVRAAAAGGKAGWVEWAAERWHGSMPRVAGVPGRPGPSVLPPDSLSPPEHPRAVRPTSRSPLLVRILGAA